MIFAQVFIFFDSLQSLINVNKILSSIISDIINLYPSNNIRRMLLRNSINEDTINIDIYNSSFNLETITSLMLDNRIYSNGSFFICILLDDESYDEKITDRYDEARKLFPIGLIKTPLVVPALTYTDFATAPSRAPNNDLYFISMNSGCYVSPIYEIEPTYYYESDEDAPYPISLIDQFGNSVYDSPSISSPILTSIENFYNKDLVLAQLFTKALCSSITRLRIFGKNLKIKIDNNIFSIEGYLNIKCKPNIKEPDTYYKIENNNIEDLQISINKEKFDYNTPIVFESDSINEINGVGSLDVDVKNDIDIAYKLLVRIPNPISSSSVLGLLLNIDDKNTCLNVSVRPDRVVFNDKIDGKWNAETSVKINCTNEMLIFIDTLEDCWLIYIDNGIDKVYATRKFSSIGYKFSKYLVLNNNQPSINAINLIYYNKKLDIDYNIVNRNPLEYSTIGIDYKIWEVSFNWNDFRKYVELFFVVDNKDLINTDIIFSLTVAYDDYKDTYVNTVLTRINGITKKLIFQFNKDDQIRAKVDNEFKIMMVENSASIIINKNVYYFNLDSNCDVKNIKYLVWKQNLDNKSFMLKESSFDYGQLGAIWGYYSLPIHKYNNFEYVNSKYLLPVKSPQFLCENLEFDTPVWITYDNNTLKFDL